jgi:hypothetical protein
MIGIILYILSGFINFFIFYKKHNQQLQDRIKSYELIIECKEFWIIYIAPWFWFITLPGYILWQIMEKVYKLINK